MSEFWDKIKAIRVDVPEGQSSEWRVVKKQTLSLVTRIVLLLQKGKKWE